MASSGNASAPVHIDGVSGSSMPQWKRDLIQRRRQQTKVLASSGASVKLCSAVIGSPEAFDLFAPQEQCAAVRNGNNVTSAKLQVAGDSGTSAESPCGATALPCAATGLPPLGASPCEVQQAGQSVACNMRLEADLSLCSELEDVSNGTTSCEPTMEPKSESTEGSRESLRMSKRQESEPRRFFVTAKLKSVSVDTALQRRRSGQTEECESDSSEELQYGPGIVNKLKSKYLNLTLREMNKSRASVQRFRRAASLEDLLDCDTEECIERSNATARKYAKRSAAGGAAAKTDRYRNASRGNESMKRARSVETLMRYNSNNAEDSSQGGQLVGNRIVKQEPVNDHIILIDRSSVKIESRLADVERPRTLNKPKRLKPVLAETERPPPDLVKTTMRIFEGSARRLKPKGEVAAKVATFKTINDSLKAQSQRKIIPKSQTKFANGGVLRAPTSPKKIAPAIPKGAHESHRNDGVITDGIAQSVSSVVSKFQQIEKSQSPSSSPEPSQYKIRFSPAPSPEPNSRSRAPLEISVKSPPVTPVPSPRISSPSSSPKKCLVPSLVPSKTSPTRETQIVVELEKAPPAENNEEKVDVEDAGMQETPLEEDKESDEKITDEVVDGPRSISRSALDNIGRAGTTMQFSFGNRLNSDISYLPGAMQNGQIPSSTPDLKNGNENGGCAEVVLRLQEQPELDKNEKEDGKVDLPLLIETNKSVGAISSLGLVRSTTTTTFPQGNESKTIRSQKSESIPSPPQKQIGIIRPLVSTKTQLPQQNLSNRELEKNLINRVKSIEQPTKVVVSLKSAEEIQPAKKGAPGSGGLWDTKPWNQQNNTMVFNFSNRKDVPDYIENDGLIIRRKRDKSKVSQSSFDLFSFL